MMKVLPHTRRLNDVRNEDELIRQIHQAIESWDAPSLRMLLSRSSYDGHSSLSYSSSTRENENIITSFVPLQLVMEKQGDTAPALLQVLIDHGCATMLQVTHPSCTFSAVHTACQQGNASLLRILLKSSSSIRNGSPVLQLKQGQPPLTPLHTLLNFWKKQNYKKPGSSRSSSSGLTGNYAECLKLLLEQPQANILLCQLDVHGRDVLQHACDKGLTQAVEILLEAQPRTLRYIFRSKTFTAWHYAAAAGCTDILKLLLDAQGSEKRRGMLLQARDDRGNTALHVAAKTKNANPLNTKATMEFLLQLGSNPNLLNKLGETPLLVVLHDWKVERRPLVTLLLQNGADPNVALPVCTGDTVHGEAILVHAILRHGPAIRQRQLIAQTQVRAMIAILTKHSTAWTPLHIACFYGDVSVVRHLLKECGANPNATDGNGRTPLFCSGLPPTMEVSRRGSLDMLAHVAQSANNPLPLDAEDWSIANNLRRVIDDDDNDNTCKGINDTAVSLLLAHGAKVNQLDVHGHLPFFFACAQDGDLTTIFQMIQVGSRQGLFGATGRTTDMLRHSHRIKLRSEGCIVL